MEKKFVIMEVKEVKEFAPAGLGKFIPADGNKADRGHMECLYLHPSRIIPASRLRYGPPQNGETYLCWVNNGIAGFQESYSDHQNTRLILDPEPKRDEWDIWIANCPLNIEGRKELQEWFQAMPRRDK